MDNVNYQKFEKKESQEKYTNKINALRDKAIEDFKKLREEVATDLAPIEKDNLVKDCNENIHLYQKYVGRLADEKLLLNNIKSKLEEMEGELCDYYRFHWDKSTKLTESAISKYAIAHPMYNSLNTYAEVIKVIVGFLDSTVKAFSDRNFTIRNIIEVRKIELGLV